MFQELPGPGVAGSWICSRWRQKTGFWRGEQSQGILSSNLGVLELVLQVLGSKGTETISFMLLKDPFTWREDAKLSRLPGNRIL